jgi:hypothetical protein
MKPILRLDKEGNNNFTFFEITDDNCIIISGNRWKEKRVGGMPIYGSCKTDQLGSRKMAKAILDILIKETTINKITSK